MGENKRELSTINMLYSFKKVVILHPYLPYRSTTTTIFCPQGGRCGEVWL